jgi:hypothetical protein
MFLAVPVILATVIVIFWGASKLVSSSYVDVIFGFGVVTLPPALFSSVYVIFFKRTKQHPEAWVRVLSRILFSAGILISAVVLVMDMINFFGEFKIDISSYYSFNLVYMAGNVAMLFLIAIMQAFTTKKEVDWMYRKR